jgi:predicted nucleic acid-binding protein
MIEDKVVEIRRQQGLKSPDAIIAATAYIHGLTLITLDQRLERSWADLE